MHGGTEHDPSPFHPDRRARAASRAPSVPFFASSPRGIVRQSSPKTESARRGASVGMRKAPDRTVEGLAKSASRSRGRLLLRQG